MNFQEIETAIGQHLEGMGSIPIAWPNRAFEPNGAYLEFRMSPNDVVDPVISGGFEYELGIALVTVITPANKFTAQSNAIAQQVKERFPKALRLPFTGGNVVITAPVSRGSSFQDGTYWRQPLRISYITEPRAEAPPPPTAFGQFDFSDPANSGLAALLMETV